MRRPWVTTPPDYSTLCRRINKLDASIKDSLSDIECGDMAVHLVPDGTGITPATRSEYVRVVHHLKRGFLRMTIMINKETLEIVSAKITKDDVGESVVFDDLLNDVTCRLSEVQA